MYSISALLGYLAGQEILIDPWVPVGRESYYRYQVLLAILWGLVTWIMLAGICHLLALVGKGNGSGGRSTTIYFLQAISAI
jgi:hypothetical protein